MTNRVLASLFAACAIAAASAAQTPIDPAVGPPVPISQPAEWQRELLRLADSAFVRMPLVPHQKNRARGQLTVVEAALELGDLELAAAVGDTIPDWRRGLAHAECALCLGKRGDRDGALQHAAIAEAIARAAASDATEQSWRPARVFAALSRVHHVLGDEAESSRLARDLEPSDAAAIQRDAALAMPLDAFPKWLARADEEFAGNHFDSILATLETCCALFERFFDDIDRRDQLQHRVLEAYPKLPRDARLKMILQLAATSAVHGDSGRALELVHEAERIVDGVRFHTEDEVHLRARIAGITSLAGNTADGRKRLDAAQRLYDENEKSVADVYRAAVLRSLAEAAFDGGDRDRAFVTWRRAIEAGTVNPNSRPRADDLAATCLSLVRRGVQPPSDLVDRLRTVANALRDPW